MPDLLPHLPLPLAGFVSRLRAAGFGVDASREFQLRRVLHEQGADYIGRFGELKYALAPYVATNANEQRRFYQLWEDYVRELEQQLAAADKAASPKNIGRRNAATYLLLGLAALLLGWFIISTLFGEEVIPAKEPIRVTLSQEAEVRAGQPLQVRNATLLEIPTDSLRFKWEISVVESGKQLVAFDSLFQLAYEVPDSLTGSTLQVRLSASPLPGGKDTLLTDSLTLAVLCGDAPFVSNPQWPFGAVRRGEEVTLSLPQDAEDGVDYLWIMGEDTLAGTQVQYTFLTEGQTKVQVLAQRRENPAYCFTLLPPHSVQVGSDLPVIPSIPLQRDKARQVLFANTALYLLPLLVGLFGYFLHRRHWRKREDENKEKTDEELAEEYPFYDVGPYVIPYQDQGGQISVPADFYRIADQLRVREEGLRMVFDGRATVEATVREGGFPAWRERAVKRPANYLVLLRHTDEFHQQDRLLKRLTDFLAAREAALDVYYHGGDFSWFWNEEHPKGWSPGQLKSRYGEHRLIIMGDGHGLLDAFHRGDPRLLPLKERWLHGWSRRLLLTTEPVVDWSFQEVLLHEHCLLFPATTDGILRGVADLNQVEEYQGGSYPRWKAERLRRDPEPTYRYRTWKTVEDHEAYLEDDPELLRWLTAMSVVPHPDWSLTIAIGRALGLEVTHDRLLRLSRIPWLAANSPDQDLRLAFLDRLQYADEQLARAAALEQLEIVSAEVANTFAETEWTANQAVQAFALAPQEMKNQDKVRDLRRLGLLAPDQLAELDLVAERQFPEQKLRRQSPAGDPLYLDELLNPPPKPKEILNEREKQLLALLVVCLLMALPTYLYNDSDDRELQEGETPAWWQVVENPTDDDQLALEANNRAVLLAEYLDRAETYSEYRNRSLNAETRIGSGLDSALQYRPVYPLADSNKTAFLLNQKAYSLNWLVADSLKGLPGDYARIGTMLTETTEQMVEKYGTTSAYTLQGLHMEGLYEWWNWQQLNGEDVDDKASVLSRFSRAVEIKERIDSLDPTYFRLLADSMPVHLAYLLARDSVTFKRDFREEVDFNDLRIRGRVIDQNGTPVEGAVVKVLDKTDAALTDGAGNFQLTMPVSLGYLTVTAGNVAKEVDLLTPDGEIPQSGRIGDIQLDFVQQVQQSVQVTGRVIDTQGNSLAGVRVSLDGINEPYYTPENGRFSFTLNQPLEDFRLTFVLDDGSGAAIFYKWEDTGGDIGDFTFSREELAVYDINGRVVNDKGVPLAGVDIALEGSNVRTKTNADGTFNVDVPSNTGKYTFAFTQGGTTVTKSFGYVDGPAGSMGDVVLTSEVSNPEDDKLLQQLRDFGNYRYAKVARQVGNASASSIFVSKLIRRYERVPRTIRVITGDELVADGGTVTPLPGHSPEGQFYLWDASLSDGLAGRLLNQLRGISSALIINGTEFSDNYLIPGPDLANLGRNVTLLGSTLQSAGFDVRTLQNPGKDEVLQVLAEYAKQNYEKKGQLFVYLGGYYRDGQLAVKDNFAGLMSGVITEETLDNAINDLLAAPHLLVVKNYTTPPAPTVDPGEQNTAPREGDIVLVETSITSGKLGLGFDREPELPRNSMPSTAGSMVFSVCIDNAGQFTTVKFEQAKSTYFTDGSVQKVQNLISQWRVNVGPKGGPPDGECGEITLGFAELR